MSDLILHQYEVSPFSEKARRMLAFKGLPWTSVRAPAVMPKPDLSALTGGYRKIPILQIGNHVYCDTALMARVLERLAPEPTLFPSPVAEVLAQWADTTLFEVVVPTGMRPTRFDDLLKYLTQEELSKIQADRASMRQDGRFKPLPFAASQSHLSTYLGRLESMLASTAFLLGDAPCVFDFSAYHCTWFLRMNAPAPLDAFPNLRAWMDRIAAIATPAVTDVTSEEALRVCRESPADFAPTGSSDDVSGVPLGAPCVVRALDYGRDPVEGELVYATAEEVAIRREDPRAGTVFVHFPRVGFEIAAPKV